MPPPSRSGVARGRCRPWCRTFPRSRGSLSALTKLSGETSTAPSGVVRTFIVGTVRGRRGAEDQFASNSTGRLVGPLRVAIGFHGAGPARRGFRIRAVRTFRASASSWRARLAPRFGVLGDQAQRSAHDRRMAHRLLDRAHRQLGPLPQQFPLVGVLAQQLHRGGCRHPRRGSGRTAGRRSGCVAAGRPCRRRSRRARPMRA